MYRSLLCEYSWRVVCSQAHYDASASPTVVVVVCCGESSRVHLYAPPLTRTTHISVQSKTTVRLCQRSTRNILRYPDDDGWSRRDRVSSQRGDGKVGMILHVFSLHNFNEFSFTICKCICIFCIYVLYLLSVVTS